MLALWEMLLAINASRCDVLRIYCEDFEGLLREFDYVRSYSDTEARLEESLVRIEE
jgi:hypothetical protein